MRIKTLIHTLNFTLLLAITASDSSATSVVYTRAADLIDQADFVFVGVVEGKRENTPDRSKIDDPTKFNESRPFTFVTFAIDEVLKGPRGRKRLTLRFFGGKGPNGVGRIEMVGSPKFDVDGKYLVFVQRTNFGEAPVVGMTQGQFEFVLDEVSSTEILVDAWDRQIVGIEKEDWIRIPRSGDDTGPSLTSKVLSASDGIVVVDANVAETKRLQRIAEGSSESVGAEVALEALRQHMEVRKSLPGHKPGNFRASDNLLEDRGNEK